MSGSGVKERNSRTYLCLSKRTRYVAHTLCASRLTTNEFPAG